MEADLIFYRRRSAEELAAAAAASTGKVRDIHLELARNYADRINALEAERRRAELHLVTAA